MTGVSWLHACAVRYAQSTMPRRGWRVIVLEEVTLISAPVTLCFDLARSVEVHLAGNTHFGEEAIAEAGSNSGLLGFGDTVTWRACHFGIRQRLTSQITV